MELNFKERKIIMDLGSGIAIAGIWIFAGCGFASSDVSGAGKWLVLITAIVMTIIIL